MILCNYLVLPHAPIVRPTYMCDKSNRHDTSSHSTLFPHVSPEARRAPPPPRPPTRRKVRSTLVPRRGGTFCGDDMCLIHAICLISLFAFCLRGLSTKFRALKTCQCCYVTCPGLGRVGHNEIYRRALSRTIHVNQVPFLQRHVSHSRSRLQLAP